ncbi:MAG: hypothetical protein ACFFC7_22735 [Candidatus Hermodarchaeota archaeon]
MKNIYLDFNLEDYQVIMGFHPSVRYQCQSCQLKCCAKDYSLSLINNEATWLSENCPDIANLISKEVLEKVGGGKQTQFVLQRFDKCIFLTTDGLCELQKKFQKKPFLCQVYPLIFAKFSSSLILAYIYPCRGGGFRWISQDVHSQEYQIIQEMKAILESHLSRFHSYLADYIDVYNPYENVPITRIEKVRDLRDLLLQDPAKFYEAISKQVSLSFKQATRGILTQWLQVNSFKNLRGIKNIVSPMIWLVFNPKLLNLPEKRALEFYYFSITYGMMLGLKLLPESWVSEKQELLKQECIPKLFKTVQNEEAGTVAILEQISWALIKTVEREFWIELEQLKELREFKKIKKFIQEMLEAL